MKSTRYPVQGKIPKRQASNILLTLAKAAIAILLLAALLYRGNIDFRSLSSLLEKPWTVFAAGLLVLLTLPLATLRWAIILRLLGEQVPLMSLFHIQCIATASNQILFGPTSADAIRGIYIWRLLRGKAAAIAVSIVADRMLGLMGLIVVGGLFTALRLQRMRDVPQLTALLVPLAIGFGGIVVVGAAILTMPSTFHWLLRHLGRFTRLASLLTQLNAMLMAFRGHPYALAAAFSIAVLGHVLSILAFAIVALQLDIGALTAVDYTVAAPLAFLANTLPLTPGGLGVGEAAFDKICHWLEPVSSSAAYASIFFAYRAISTLMLLVGFLSFVVFRIDDKDTQAN